MDLAEKIQLLRNRVEKLDKDLPESEVKLLTEMVDVVSQIEDKLQSVSNDVDEVFNGIEDTNERMKEFFEESCEDCCDGCENCGYDDEDFGYTLECPVCNNEVFVTEKSFSDGVVICPCCDEDLRVDFRLTPDFKDE